MDDSVTAEMVRVEGRLGPIAVGRRVVGSHWLGVLKGCGFSSLEEPPWLTKSRWSLILQSLVLKGLRLCCCKLYFRRLLVATGSV